MTSQDRVDARLTWVRTVLGDHSLTLEPAFSDASFRSYWRIHPPKHDGLVMDCPPPHEDARPWLTIGARLAAAGVRVPKVYAQDLMQGFVLIEDLGPRQYLDVLNTVNADSLYGAAMEALLTMQTRVMSKDLPPFNRTLLLHGLHVMPTWFLGRYLDHVPDSDQWNVLQRAFELIVDNALTQPQCFVHRDFHSRNLLPVKPGCPGIIDFQGALHGPVTYDLVSLLRDAYITWPHERVTAWVTSYWQHLRGVGVIGETVDSTCFGRWFDLTGLQRHLRLLGQFVQLACRDGKKGYLENLPQVYQYVIEVTRSYPELGALADLLERFATSHLPPRPVVSA